MIANDVFVKHLTTKNLSPSLEALKNTHLDIEDSVLFNLNEIDKEANLGEEAIRKLKSKRKNMTYLDLLVILTMRFMEGQALESISWSFKKQNSAVNATCCEFLEMLISHLEDE